MRGRVDRAKHLSHGVRVRFRRWCRILTRRAARSRASSSGTRSSAIAASRRPARWAAPATICRPAWASACAFEARSAGDVLPPVQLKVAWVAVHHHEQSTAESRQRPRRHLQPVGVIGRGFDDGQRRVSVWISGGAFARIQMDARSVVDLIARDDEAGSRVLRRWASPSRSPS